MESSALTALPRLFERLAMRLAAAQDMADCGLHATAFGYLEESVQFALDTWSEAVVILEGGERGGSTAVELPAYDCADVWRGVESLPLFPIDQ
jgi:hypothetical protein